MKKKNKERRIKSDGWSCKQYLLRGELRRLLPDVVTKSDFYRRGHWFDYRLKGLNVVISIVGKSGHNPDAAVTMFEDCWEILYINYDYTEQELLSLVEKIKNVYANPPPGLYDGRSMHTKKEHKKEIQREFAEQIRKQSELTKLPF